mgnify:CR=1 FL=1
MSKIYKNKYMVICGNCEEETELDTWGIKKGASKRMCLAQVKGINKALEIVRKEMEG